MTSYPLDELLTLAPLLATAVAGVLALLVDCYLAPGKSKVLLGYVAVGGVLLALIGCLSTWGLNETPRVVLGGSIAVSRASLVLATAILLGAGATALASTHYAQGTAVSSGETFALILLSTTGMLGLVVANDLATLFVALETLSIGVYALTGSARHHPRSAEGAMKYFLLGAFSSGFLLYGIALVYAATGSLRLDVIEKIGFTAHGPLGLTGTVLILIGLLFKLGAVPFHAWVPDAYEGAPANAMGFMSVAVKAAALGAALRVTIALGSARALGAGGADVRLSWLLWAVAAATMVIGNAGAFTQSNPRRLLAYSGIAHTGYVLTALVAVARCLDARRHVGPGDPALEILDQAARDAAGGLVFYALAYAAANLAAIAVLCALERRGEDVEDTAQLAGLARTRPGAALAMTIAMISLAGIPGTAGFVGKLWVFRSAVAAGDTGLVVLGLGASALSLYYYLRIVVIMYMKNPEGALAADPATGDRFGARAAYAACAFLAVALGVLPGRILDLAASAGKML